jgi:hypothetical protein
MEDELNKLFEKIENTCSTLAITHDSPDFETIKGWFQEYEKIKAKLELAKPIPEHKPVYLGATDGNGFIVGFNQNPDHKRFVFKLPEHEK